MAEGDPGVPAHPNHKFVLSASQCLFLSEHASLPAVPYLGGFGEYCWFRTPEDLLRIHSELQQLDSIMDPLLFAAVAQNAHYHQKAQLVTNQWRHICWFGRATFLSAVACSY